MSFTHSIMHASSVSGSAKYVLRFNVDVDVDDETDEDEAGNEDD